MCTFWWLLSWPEQIPRRKPPKSQPPWMPPAPIHPTQTWPPVWRHHSITSTQSLVWRARSLFEVLLWAFSWGPVTQVPLPPWALDLRKYVCSRFSGTTSYYGSQLCLEACAFNLSRASRLFTRHIFKSTWAKSQWDFFFLSSKPGLSNINTQLFLQMCDNMPQTCRAVFPRNATNALGFLPWYSGLKNSSKAAWDLLGSWSKS